MKSFSDSYKAAGVDVTAGYKAVELMKAHVAKTMTSGVLTGLGGFGGLFELDLSGIQKPVLVSGTDGVGTKLKLAILQDKHDTVGIDCVAMCVNDIICCGAKPLFFLDYVAVGKNYPEKVAQIVSGVAEGCVQAGCALIGGENAEMPGFIRKNDMTLPVSAVGVVDKSNILDNTKQKPVTLSLALPPAACSFQWIFAGPQGIRYRACRLGKILSRAGSNPGRNPLNPYQNLCKTLTGTD